MIDMREAARAAEALLTSAIESGAADEVQTEAVLAHLRAALEAPDPAAEMKRRVSELEHDANVLASRVLSLLSMKPRWGRRARRSRARRRLPRLASDPTAERQRARRRRRTRRASVDVDPERLRDRYRSGRKRVQRAKTVSVKRMTKRELEHGRALYPETGYWRPRRRGDCKDVPRPCPYVACVHHLYLDVNPHTGSIKLNFPDLEVEEVTESCVLDLADSSGMTLEEVGELLNVTRERIRQLEARYLAELKAMRRAAGLAEAFKLGGMSAPPGRVV